MPQDRPYTVDVEGYGSFTAPAGTTPAQIQELARRFIASKGTQSPLGLVGKPPETLPGGEPVAEDPGLTSLVNALPEAAGLGAMFAPGGPGVKLLLQLLAPAAGEVARQGLQDETFSLGDVATRTALNAVPIPVGRGATAAAEKFGGMSTRQALARGMKSATPKAEELLVGHGRLPAGANVQHMTAAATREGASLSPADVQRFAQYARELRHIKTRGLNRTAQAAYLRARPAVAEALQRSGGNVDAAIAEFSALAETLAKASEGAARQGFNWPRFLAGAGVGGMVDYSTGMPGLGTAVGTTLGAMEASMPLKFGVGRALTGQADIAGTVAEALARSGLTGIQAASPPDPQRRRLTSR